MVQVGALCHEEHVREPEREEGRAHAVLEADDDTDSGSNHQPKKHLHVGDGDGLHPLKVCIPCAPLEEDNIEQDEEEDKKEPSKMQEEKWGRGEREKLRREIGGRKREAREELEY